MSNSRWMQERKGLFREEISEFGIKITVNGVELDAIGPPQEKIKQMMEGPFINIRDAQFEVFRSDYVSQKIRNDKLIGYCGLTFQVFSIVDDQSDEGVRLNAKLIQ